MSVTAEMLLDTLQPKIVQRALAAVYGQDQESPSGEEDRRGVELALEALRKTLSGESPEAYAEFWRQWTYVRCTAGAPLEMVQDEHQGCNAVFQAALKQGTAGNLPWQMEVLEQCVATFEGSLLSLFHGYEQAREDLFETQQRYIRQLSTPILPVYAGVLVLPLIGPIDSSRANEMSARLLDGIVHFRASVVIVDITGIPVVDVAVAHHLVQVAGAAALVGARLVLVGIRPEAAMALVHQDESFAGLPILADLQAGVEHALRLRGLTIARRGPVASLEEKS